MHRLGPPSGDVSTLKRTRHRVVRQSPWFTTKDPPNPQHTSITPPTFSHNSVGECRALSITLPPTTTTSSCDDPGQKRPSAPPPHFVARRRPSDDMAAEPSAHCFVPRVRQNGSSNSTIATTLDNGDDGDDGGVFNPSSREGSDLTSNHSSHAEGTGGSRRAHPGQWRHPSTNRPTPSCDGTGGGQRPGRRCTNTPYVDSGETQRSLAAGCTNPYASALAAPRGCKLN
jgi:hypothetical protein